MSVEILLSQNYILVTCILCEYYYICKQIKSCKIHSKRNMYIKYIKNVEKSQSGDSIQTSNNALKIELRSPNYVYFNDIKTCSLCG